MSLKSSRVIWVYGATLAVIASGYGVMFTVLDDYRDEYGISESHLGFVVAIGFFTSFFAQLVIAPMADRGRARALVLAGIVLNIAGTLLMAYGTTVTPLIIGRVLMGLGAGAASPSIRRIVILADPEHLGPNLGRLLSIDVAGFAAGPLLSAVTVSSFGVPAPYILIAVALTALIPLVIRTAVQETVESDSQQRFAWDLLQIRPLAGAIVIGLALYLMIGTFDVLWVLTMADLNAPDWMANLGIVIFVIPLIILGPRGGALAQKFGPFPVGALGLLLAAGYMSLYGLAPAAWMLMIVGAFHAITDGLSVTGMSIAVGLTAPPERQAAAQGLLGGLQTLVAGISASAAGWSYEKAGRATTFLVTSAIMVLLVGIGWTLAGPARNLRTTDSPSPA